MFKEGIEYSLLSKIVIKENANLHKLRKIVQAWSGDVPKGCYLYSDISYSYDTRELFIGEPIGEMPLFDSFIASIAKMLEDQVIMFQEWNTAESKLLAIAVQDNKAFYTDVTVTVLATEEIPVLEMKPAIENTQDIIRD